MQTAAPLKKSERMTWIDAARGFAILGIFIVNIGAFSAPYFLYGGGMEAWDNTIDQSVQILIDIFFQASFYTLFSILFGFGLQILKERLEEKAIAVQPFIFRRLLILIGFGLVHAFLIWHGDILLSYGIIGLFVIAFIFNDEKTILTWGSLILFASVSLYTLTLYNAKDLLGSANTSGIYLAMDNYASDNLTAILGQNLNDWLYSNSVFSYMLLGTTLLPLFLFGMYLGKKRWLHRPAEFRQELRRGWLISLIFFGMLKAGPYLFDNPEWFSYAQDNLGGTASALFYLFSITLLGQSQFGKKLLKPFSFVGRMSMSNYILQSLICFVLFYGIGFGLYGSVRPVEAMGIVALVYTAQIFFSKWWLSMYRFGPLEWLWRSLTYKEMQPLRNRE
ncbi:DUF418 domain-containing protein [Lentibacillus amyloliquefaciens]|uniref:DUF418 domain-containing protein n=1 Tax=Lentibacillus amyloliquefaciens TaxID=1472767 RepID=A0A0U4FLR2_9BACI|nr:DUF418 domain-containing protein [Lentibacillus amyloliquefaciens]ALX48676.1 hypothetical protein AOX59_08665 [Lentibacillus amyloliquefaciens]